MTNFIMTDDFPKNQAEFWKHDFMESITTINLPFRLLDF